jgi:hypothetical protein
MSLNTRTAEFATLLEMVRFAVSKHPQILEELAKSHATAGHASVKSVFTDIFEGNMWASSESVSGPGSELVYTEKLRTGLAHLVDELGITSILDAPCGDYNWMKVFMKDRPIRYIGGDIVSSLVSNLNAQHASETVSFIELDITQDALPDADLMIVRDCLFHLPYSHIHAFMNNFAKSNVSYLLTTTHINDHGFANSDINAGGFRLIDLFRTPFFFPEDPLRRIDDWIAPHPRREMVLFSREQVQAASLHIGQRLV